MGGKRRRVRRGRRWGLRLFVATAVTASAVLWPQLFQRSASPRVECGRKTCIEAASQPREVANPRYLEATYIAPPGRSVPHIGNLAIPRLGISAPVVGVGWDREAMSVPNDPRTLGWFTPSAHLDDLVGTSLIAGHVSDSSDRPGALARLVEMELGDLVEWRGASGGLLSFRVVAIGRYPRTKGLPPSLFKVDGPHVLRLITCTNRQATAGGIHYADNLVVSAVAVER